MNDRLTILTALIGPEYRQLYENNAEFHAAVISIAEGLPHIVRSLAVACSERGAQQEAMVQRLRESVLLPSDRIYPRL